MRMLAILLVLTAVPVLAQQPVRLLDVSADQTAPGERAAADRAALANRFVALVRSGERDLSAWFARREVARPPELWRALEAFRQALALRERERLGRAEVGELLYQPDLDLALTYFYLGNHGAALANLGRPLAQGVPAGADVGVASRIQAQTAKARDLQGRLLSPWLPGYQPVAQREGNTCAPTAVHMDLVGMGLAASLARGEALRGQHQGELARVAADGVTVGSEAGGTLDAAWTEQTVTRDPEVGWPGGVTLEAVRDQLARGYAVVVSARSYTKPEAGYQAWTSGHYVLAVGAKSDAHGRVTRLFVLDPDGGLYRRFDRDEFEAIWERDRRGALVLVPRAPARRWRCRTAVRSIVDREAAARKWVGRAASS